MVFGERDLLEGLGFTLQFLPRGSTGVVVLGVRRFRLSKATMACRVGDRCYQNVNRTPIEKFYLTLKQEINWPSSELRLAFRSQVRIGLVTAY